MKRCPACQRTYPDAAQIFCADDGTRLNDESAAAGDLQKTMVAPPPPSYTPPEQPPPPSWSPPGTGSQQQQPGWGQSPPQNPYGQPQYGQQQQSYGQQPHGQPSPGQPPWGGSYQPPGGGPAAYGAAAGGRKSWHLIALIVGVLVVLGIGTAVLLMALGGSKPNNSKRDIDINVDSGSNRNGSTTNRNGSSTKSSASMTEDEKYRIFYAAGKTNDRELQKEVAVLIGIVDSKGTPTSYYQPFVTGAFAWASRDRSFPPTVDTPEKARAYVMSHK